MPYSTLLIFLLRGQCLRLAAGPALFEDSWQGYTHKTDSRHVYALNGLFLRTSVLWKQRTSGHPRGKNMVYFGKVIPKVTTPVVTFGIKLPFGQGYASFR